MADEKHSDTDQEMQKSTTARKKGTTPHVVTVKVNTRHVSEAAPNSSLLPLSRRSSPRLQVCKPHQYLSASSQLYLYLDKPHLLINHQQANSSNLAVMLTQ
ncbi:uncharacterized protein LOC143231597 [Tachypleus tridentatus]|uniref:uncharacterized protein LOC143231597 n=1 Tax=Tachypleus tridentatus TaxID=6853 RepID=UPI003FD119A2